MNQPNNFRYFLYARKSSEGEDKQVASVASQIAELTALAKQNGYQIVETFTEERSAKSPGRPVFNKMMADLHAGKADGVLCWKLDRLARNPVDGGTINWMLQQAVIRHIRTINKDYFPTDNVLMMSLEFGMANQFVIDLSANTKRGQRSKVQDGWLPHKPPLGYLNNKHQLPELDPIYPDPSAFPLMKRMWGILIEKRCSIEELYVIAQKAGLKKDRAIKITRTNFYRLFRNPFYYGAIYWDGKISPGKHKPMISKREFDLAQEIMNGGLVRKPQTHEFAFTGLVRCGECGAAITAEEKTKHQKNGNTHHYTYYRCTKRIKRDCSQPPITLKEFESQVAEVLSGITIPPLFREWALKQLREEHEDEISSREEVTRSYRLNLDACNRKLDVLLNLRLSNDINQEEYTTKKEALLSEKAKYNELLRDVQGRQSTWLRRAEDTFSFAETAQERFQNGSLDVKRQILSCLGSNLILKDRKLQISVEKRFALFQDAQPQIKNLQNRLEPGVLIGEMEAKNTASKFWGG